MSVWEDEVQMKRHPKESLSKTKNEKTKSNSQGNVCHAVIMEYK